MVKSFLKAILDIVLLRAGPQSLAYSPKTLIGLILVGFLIVGAVAGSYVTLLLIKVVFTLALVWILLYHLKKKERFVQTITALIAAEWIVSIIFTVIWYIVLAITALFGHLKGISASNLYAIFTVHPDPSLLPHAVLGLLGLSLLVLAIWKFIIYTNIIRQAADWSSIRAVIFIFFLMLFPAMVQQAVLNKGLIGNVPQKTVATSATTTEKAASPTNVIPLK